jgi:hypothetical protein
MPLLVTVGIVVFLLLALAGFVCCLLASRVSQWMERHRSVYSSVQSGAWRDEATWDGDGWPGDTAGRYDTVIIAGGHTVTADADTWNSCEELQRVTVLKGATFHLGAPRQAPQTLSDILVTDTSEWDSGETS